MKQLNMIDDLGWLLDKNWRPKNVAHFTSKESRRIWDKFDENKRFDTWLLSTYGYNNNQQVKYSIKKGKNTLLGNPFMMEGL